MYRKIDGTLPEELNLFQATRVPKRSKPELISPVRHHHPFNVMAFRCFFDVDELFDLKAAS